MRELTIRGNVGRLDDVKTVKIKDEDRQVLNFSLAYNDGPKDNRTTTWYECAAWGKRAEFLSKALSKGSFVQVRGDVRVETYETKDGKTGVTQRITVNDVFGPVQSLSSSDSEGGDSNFTDNDIPF